MIVNFTVKYVGRCTNGHKLNPGDNARYVENAILCDECDYKEPAKVEQYSNKFCNECHMEISLSGEHDCY